MTLWFEDMPVGFRYETGWRGLDEDAITGFARQWDPQPFHIDRQAAAASAYGGIIASGFHTLLTAFNLCYETGLWAEASMGASGIERVRFLRPVRPGDRLRVEAEVIASRPSASRPDRGRTVFRYSVFNQDGMAVLDYEAEHLFRRCPD
ncbi:MAG: MaoC family dehydratase [Paracoccaceae bacterium]